MKEKIQPLSEYERRFQELPLSVKCYFEREKQKRDPKITPDKRIELEQLQLEIKSQWNPQETKQFFDYLSFQEQQIKLAARGGINNGRKF